MIFSLQKCRDIVFRKYRAQDMTRVATVSSPLSWTGETVENYEVEKRKIQFTCSWNCKKQSRRNLSKNIWNRNARGCRSYCPVQFPLLSSNCDLSSILKYHATDYTRDYTISFPMNGINWLFPFSECAVVFSSFSFFGSWAEYWFSNFR